MIKVIGQLSELNREPRKTDSDLITIDKHDNVLYIYPRFHLWRGVIFELDNITKILIDNGCTFYLSDTRYDKAAIVVPF